MIAESQDYTDRVRWFTSLVGRKKSLKPLSTLFRDLGITFRVTTFYQGKTTRWAVAWTFLNTQEPTVPAGTLTVTSPSVSQTFLRAANLLTTLGVDYNANFTDNWFEYSAERERSGPAETEGLQTAGPSLPPATEVQQSTKEARLTLTAIPSGVCLTFQPPNPKLLSALEKLFAGS